MSIRRASSGVPPSPVALARRADGAFLDVQIAWCQPPGDLTGAVGDAGPPAWSVGVADGTVQAELVRTPAPGTTLAAIDDPFACGAIGSPARISATRVALATQLAAAANATEAFTAYACSPTPPPGYGLSTDATGGLWAAPTGTVAPTSCAVLASAAFAPRLAGPLQLQQAPTSTSNPSLPSLGNLSWPNAGVAALCGPYVASALVSANYSAPLQSIGASVQAGVQNRVFGALGPVGGSVVLVMVGGIVTGVVTGLNAWLSKRQRASTDAGAAGQAPLPPSGDVAADPNAIALAPQRYNPLAAADRLATPLTMPKTYDELVGAGSDPYGLTHTLSYGGAATPPTPAAAAAGPSYPAAPDVGAPPPRALDAPPSAPVAPVTPAPAPSDAPPVAIAPPAPPASRAAVPSGAVGAFSRTGGRTPLAGAANRRGTFAGSATAPSVDAKPATVASDAAPAPRAVRPGALTPAQSAAFSAVGKSLRTPLSTPPPAAGASAPAATPADDRQALLSRFYR